MSPSLKLGLFIMNMLCLISSLSLIIIGACDWRSSFVENILDNTKEWCLTLGVIALLTCVLGLFEIVFTSKLLEWLHFLAVLGLIIICMIHAIMDFVAKEGIVEDVHTYMQEAYNRGKYDIIDTFQRQLKCCGYKSKFEKEVKVYSGKELIESCCDDKLDKCMIEIARNINCSSRIAYISTLSTVIAFLAFLTAIMLLVLAVLLILKFIKEYKQEIEHSVHYYEDDAESDAAELEQRHTQYVGKYSTYSMHSKYSAYSPN